MSAMPWQWRFWRRPSCAGIREARAHQERIREQQPEVDYLTRVTHERGSQNHFREAWDQALRGGHA